MGAATEITGSSIFAEMDITSTPFIIIFIVFILWELLHGLRRGLLRQLVHTGLTAVAAGISLSVCTNFCQTFLDGFNEQTLSDLLAKLEEAGAAEAIGMDSASFMGLADKLQNADLLASIPMGSIVVPFLFIVVFVLVMLVAKIVGGVLNFILHLPKGGLLTSRLPGAALGAVEGAVVCALILMPFASTLALVDESVEVIREKNEPAYVQLVEDYDTYLQPVYEDSILKTIDSATASITRGFAKVKINGNDVDLRAETVGVISLGFELGTLGEADFKNLTEEQKAVITSVLDTVGGSDILATLTSDLLSGLAYTVEDSGMPFELEEPFSSLIASIIKLFETSDRDNLHGDLTTISSVYFILSDDGVLSAIESGDTDTMSDALIKRDANGDTVISKVIDTLKANSRTAELVTTLSKLSVSMLADQLHIDGVTTEVYDDVMESLDNVLAVDEADYATEEEYMAALTDTIDTALSDNGIVLKDEIVSEMATVVDAEKKKNPDMTTDDILLTYYDAYLAYVESQQANP